MSELLMLDTITPSLLSGLRFDACGGYVGGSWPDFSELVADYPALAKQNRVLSYAVQVSEDAEGADCETGDMTVPELVDVWLPRALGRKVWRPVVYANESRWLGEGLKDATDHYGSQIRRIVAAWDYVPGVNIAWAQGRQWSDRYVGRNVDANSLLADFFATAPQPPHHNGPDYTIFPTGPFPTARWGNLSEQLIVEEYDGARKHPAKYAAYLQKLEAQLKWLADRVASEAIFQDPLPAGPSWAKYKRGPRFQNLIHRSQGRQFVR